MTPISAPLPGLGVFPGGHGVWGAEVGSPLPQLRHPTVMLVANDFFTLSGFKELQKRPVGENKSEVFWRQLQSLLGDAEIPLDSCFFTNAIMGLRTDGPSTGKSPGFRHKEFRKQCATFLARQIEVIKPAVVLTLGEYAPQVLAEVAPVLVVLKPWPRFAAIDRSRSNLFADVQIRGSDVRVGAVATLLHPSFRHANVKRRCFGSFTGHKAEVELVKAAMSVGAS